MPSLGLAAKDSPERMADAVVHLIGLTAAALGIAWLASRLGPSPSARQVFSLAIYGLGLIGMLTASISFNLAQPGRRRDLLRRVDQAMIFVMIAGSYTPFALNALAPGPGTTLCVIVWTIAAIGVALEILDLRRHEWISLLLYLGMGWLILAFLGPFRAALSDETLMLLLAGGLLYSVGSLVEARGRLRFNKAIWHTTVVLAAGLHLRAVSLLFVPHA